MNVIGAKVMSKISPTITVTAADGLYKIKTKTPLKTFEWDFKIGEEVTLETPEGKKKVNKWKSMFTVRNYVKLS